MDWSRVDYYDVFISCLHSHSDGTHSLQRIHWWASDMMLNFSKSVLMKRQNHLYLGWPEGESIFSRFLLLGELFLLGNILFLFRFIHHSTHSWKKYAVNLIQSKYFPDNIFRWTWEQTSDNLFPVTVKTSLNFTEMMSPQGHERLWNMAGFSVYLPGESSETFETENKESHSPDLKLAWERRNLRNVG